MATNVNPAKAPNNTDWRLAFYGDGISIVGPSTVICDMNLEMRDKFRLADDHEAADAEFGYVRALAQYICDLVNQS